MAINDEIDSIVRRVIDVDATVAKYGAMEISPPDPLAGPFCPGVVATRLHTNQLVHFGELWDYEKDEPREMVEVNGEMVLPWVIVAVCPACEKVSHGIGGPNALQPVWLAGSDMGS